MITWYIVKRGAEIIDKAFDTFEGATFMALGMAVVTGNNWEVEKVIGWDY